MKKIVFVILILFCQQNFAQKIEYSFKNIDAKLKYELLVDISKNISQWKMIEDAKGQIVKEENENSFFVRKNDVLYLNDKILTKRIFISDMPNVKWVKNSETKTILGYTCNSATTNFRGRDYIAYYTQEILLDYGPWKFNGLNGLILLVESDDGQYSFSATKLDLENPVLNLAFIDKTIHNKDFIQWNNYIEEYKKDVDNFINSETCNCSQDGKNILKITKIEKIYPELHDTGIIY